MATATLAPAGRRHRPAWQRPDQAGARAHGCGGCDPPRRAPPTADHRRAAGAFWSRCNSRARPCCPRAAGCSLRSVLRVVEEALLRLLIECDPVPVAVLSWTVTGTWPLEAMQLQFDVSYPAEDGPQLFF